MSRNDDKNYSVIVVRYTRNKRIGEVHVTAKSASAAKAKVRAMLRKKNATVGYQDTVESKVLEDWDIDPEHKAEEFYNLTKLSLPYARYERKKDAKLK